MALALYNLSITHRLQGDTEGALARAQQALAIWRKALPAEHPDVALGMHGVAMALRAKKDFAGALAQEDAALAMDQRLLGPDADAVAEVLVDMGQAQLDAGHANAAVMPLSRALRIREGARSSALDLGEVRFALARALEKSDPARSRELAAKAREGYAGETCPRAAQGIREIDAFLAGASP